MILDGFGYGETFPKDLKLPNDEDLEYHQVFGISPRESIEWCLQTDYERFIDMQNYIHAINWDKLKYTTKLLEELDSFEDDFGREELQKVLDLYLEK